MKARKYRILELQLGKAVKDAVFAATKGGREICGLLIDNGYFIELLPTKNKNRKGGGFEFYPEEIRDINVISQKVGHEIVGTYHSHLLYIASPCRTDIANAVDDSIMLIIDATDKKTALWHIKNGKKRKVAFTHY